MKNEDQKTLFAKRLSIAMQAKGYQPKAAVLEKAFNLNYSGKPMSLHGVRKWLIGEAIPSGDKLLALAKWLDVPPEELAFDKDIKKAIEQREARWKEEIGYKDKDVVEAYLALPTAQKKIIRETIIEFSKVK
ncbi:MAG TPA: XRE family transcriptional regulator [Acinetobacter parvus]|mgnify:CR=1 FL=1|jgi:transcriptional regulator with XRE-family HTH domain|uniref:XRE family transcriptional regulator n=1 Tax=Acinetobacter parvus TaxID=134533 RepID=UPI002BFFE649|nr:XRE family transcriptional regulator [Acinetobacter parvus]HRM14270.1 XRE family transcriptional regulator [Acinetobacter parvus]